MTNRMYCDALETVRCAAKLGQDNKDWVKYSQQIATTMSKRMAELSLTQQMLAERMN